MSVLAGSASIEDGRILGGSEGRSSLGKTDVHFLGAAQPSKILAFVLLFKVYRPCFQSVLHGIQTKDFALLCGY